MKYDHVDENRLIPQFTSKTELIRKKVSENMLSQISLSEKLSRQILPMAIHFFNDSSECINKMSSNITNYHQQGPPMECGGRLI